MSESTMATRGLVDPPLRSLMWRIIGRALFRSTFHNWYRVRREILRVFGAEVATSAKIRRSVAIDRPWNFSAGELVLIGDHATFRARAPISIGHRCTISQMATVTTEMRDPERPGFPVAAARIDVGDDCWVAADALVLPGVQLASGAVVGARSMVTEHAPAWTVVAGEPASPRRQRTLRTDGGAA